MATLFMEKYNNIIDTYKPLKQIVKTTSLEDSLYTIWAYSQHLQTGNPMPQNVGVHPMFEAENPMEKGVYQWSLETLTREVLINAQRMGYSERLHQTFRTPALLMRALNQIVKIEDSIATEFLSADNIFKEFSRIAYRQFSWQRDRTDSEWLIRYYKIFSHEEVAKLLSEKVGLTIDDLFFFTLFFIGQFLNNAASSINLGNNDFSEKLNTYTSYFSKDLDIVREALIQEHTIDEQYLYGGAALKQFPLITMTYQNINRCIVCPIPTLFFWRVTSGLYYDIVSHKNFNRPFGKALEKYVGDALNKIFTDSAFKVIEESKYIVKRSEEDTVDWMLIDSKAAMFIECKSKRMTFISKTHLDSDNILKDLNVLANYIVKLYKTIEDYKEGHYNTLPFSTERAIYPIFLTLESWYIFHEEYRNKLKELIVAGLEKAKIETKVLEQHPYTLCCLSEFEDMIQIVRSIGILDYFVPKFADPKTADFEVGTYHVDRFNEIHREPIFLDEYDLLVLRTKERIEEFRKENENEKMA